MPRVRRNPPPHHLVIVDTNILWDRDKKLPVSQAFDTFWQKNSSLIPMTLNVPEVVLGELQFQQTTSALKALATINENFTELSGITSAKYLHKLHETTIKAQVKSKLERWLRIKNGVLLTTPVPDINWASVIESAVWRMPPFTFDPKDPKTEKGFRDAVVLETLAHTCTNVTSDKMVIFLCNDYLLRTAAESRLKDSKKFLIFESTADFESYINLTQEQLTNEFVKAIQSHARLKFFNKEDPNCLYVKENLSEKIEYDFPDELALHGSTSAFALLGQQTGLVTSSPKEVRRLFWIRSTQFIRLDAPRQFHWVSHIDVVILYEIQQTPGLIAGAMATIRRLRVVGFDIKWNSNVKSDGRFHDITLESVNFSGAQNLEATEENLKLWRV